jgi:hypothetical protein
MEAVDRRHAGVASGINNTVSRVAGLLAIAIFGILVGRAFDARVRPRLDRLALSSTAREAVDRELRKIAGADMTRVSSITPSQQRVIRIIVDDGFVFAFRLVMIGVAGMALAAAAVGSAIGHHDA